MTSVLTIGTRQYGCAWARTVRPHRRGGLNHYKGHEIVSGPRHGGRPDFKTFYIVIPATNCPCQWLLNLLSHFEVFCNSFNGHVKCFDIYRVLARSCLFLLRTMHINHSHFQKNPLRIFINRITMFWNSKYPSSHHWLTWYFVACSWSPDFLRNSGAWNHFPRLKPCFEFSVPKSRCSESWIITSPRRWLTCYLVSCSVFTSFTESQVRAIHSHLKKPVFEISVPNSGSSESWTITHRTVDWHDIWFLAEFSHLSPKVRYGQPLSEPRNSKFELLP